MKTRREIERTLKQHKPFLTKEFGVSRIGIFGSHVRGEESRESDIDVLVEFGQPIGWEFIDLKEFLERALGMKVDLVTGRAIKPRMRERILKEVVFA